MEVDKVRALRTPQEVDEMMAHGSSFTSMLFRLMNKADQRNWKILSKAYPHEATEFHLWLKHAADL